MEREKYNLDFLNVVLEEARKNGKSELNSDELMVECDNTKKLLNRIDELSLRLTEHGYNDTVANVLEFGSFSLKQKVDTLEMVLERFEKSEKKRKLKEIIFKEVHDLKNKLSKYIEHEIELPGVDCLQIKQFLYKIANDYSYITENTLQQLRTLSLQIDGYISLAKKVEIIKISINNKLEEINKISSANSSNEYVLASSEKIFFDVELKVILSGRNYATILDFMTALEKFSTKVDNYYNLLNELQTFEKNRILDSELSNPKVALEKQKMTKIIYHFYGYNIVIDLATKEIKFKKVNDSLKNYLKEYKINKIKEKILKRIDMMSFDEIVNTKFIGNEKMLSRIMADTNLGIEENLILDISNLIDLNNKKEESLEKIISDNNDDYFNTFISFIKKLNNFDTKEGLFEEIFRIYNHDIEITSLDKTDIKNSVIKFIKNKYPNNISTFSSLQIVYNSIDKKVINQIHGLINNKQFSVNDSNVRRVIDTLKKFARNNDRSEYTEKEIIDFLFKKNEAINDNYGSYFELGTTYDAVDIDELMHLLTGVHRR